MSNYHWNDGRLGCRCKCITQNTPAVCRVFSAVFVVLILVGIITIVPVILRDQQQMSEGLNAMTCKVYIGPFSGLSNAMRKAPALANCNDKNPCEVLQHLTGCLCDGVLAIAYHAHNETSQHCLQ